MEPDTLQLKDIKPVLMVYISKSLKLLRRTDVPDADAIHDIRVLMKKAKAVLKLTGPFLENRIFEKDIESLKSVGQIMSSWRDTSVHRKTLKEFKKKYPGIFTELKDYEAVASLLRKTDTSPEIEKQLKDDTMKIDELLTKSIYRIRFHQINNIDPAELLRNLELSFETVRKIYLECRNSPKPEGLHRFRKRSKDLLYQLYFFRQLNPAAVKSMERRLDSVTMNLGKYNDLYQLLKSIGYVNPDFSEFSIFDDLVIKMRERQDIYLLKVWPDAYKCFNPRTKLEDLLKLRVIILK
jgi:CHAD domain-containing protein